MARDPRPDLASAMYPSLSKEAKAKEAAEAKQKAEQKAQVMRDVRYMSGLWRLREGER
jgi:hypothetical protein